MNVVPTKLIEAAGFHRVSGTSSDTWAGEALSISAFLTLTNNSSVPVKYQIGGTATPTDGPTIEVGGFRSFSGITLDTGGKVWWAGTGGVADDLEVHYA